MAAYGLLRYSLTVHFRKQGLLPWSRKLGKAKELCRLVARATGEVRLPESETQIAYLQRYFNEQGLRLVNPELPEPLLARNKIRRGEDGHVEITNPLASSRWVRLRKAVFARDGRKCVRCGAKPKYRDLHVDHIIPRSINPNLTFDMDNLQALCERCHGVKTAEDCRLGIAA